MKNKHYPLYTQGELDPQAKALLDEIAEADGNQFNKMTPEEARESFLEESWIGKVDQSVKISKRMIPGPAGEIPTHIYTPEGNEKLPILIFFHGGGYVLGKLQEFDPLCSYFAAGTPCVVVSVDYRLAPENKYPAAIEDAMAAIKWVNENAALIQGDPDRIVLAGDSAGGNLAAVTTIKIRDEKIAKLSGQILICPWMDESTHDRDSYRYFGKGLWLSEANVNWCRNHYLENQGQASDPKVSPLLTEDLSNLPPAFIMTAEFDVLRDEAKEYANVLGKAGIDVEYKEFKGMLHDFITVPGLFEKAKEAVEDVCQVLKKMFVAETV